jgi:hypothetical protein
VLGCVADVDMRRSAVSSTLLPSRLPRLQRFRCPRQRPVSTRKCPPTARAFLRRYYTFSLIHRRVFIRHVHSNIDCQASVSHSCMKTGSFAATLHPASSRACASKMAQVLRANQHEQLATTVILHTSLYRCSSPDSTFAPSSVMCRRHIWPCKLRRS